MSKIIDERRQEEYLIQNTAYNMKSSLTFKKRKYEMVKTNYYSINVIPIMTFKTITILMSYYLLFEITLKRTKVRKFDRTTTFKQPIFILPNNVE